MIEKAGMLYRRGMNSAKLFMEPERIGHMELGEEGNDLLPSASVSSLAVASGRVDLRASFKQKRLWYKPAVQVARIKSRGKHEKLYPYGLVVHFNAGRDNPVSTMDSGRKNGYLYDAMGPDGTIYQSNPLNEWGYHAGSSTWNKRKGVSAYCRGLEISSAGSLSKVGDQFRPWYYKNPKDAIPKERVREVKRVANITKSGPYMAYTSAQEEALIEYCLWLKVNNPDVFNFDWVCGHDEIATPIGRKNDPGGALSMTMPALRALLKQRYIDLMK